MTFEEACSRAHDTGGDVGFMLSADDPFSCIDLDVNDDTPEEWIQRFQTIVQTFDSYTERSRGGRGMHVWVEGKVGRGRRRDGVEVYSQERFIICTGNVCHDGPIQNRAELIQRLAGQLKPKDDTEAEPLMDDPDAAQDWYAALQAFDEIGNFRDDELGRLFAGNWKGKYPSQSEADLALVTLLARFTTSDPQCWSAFQLSQLGKREKASRPDYMRGTLSEARRRLADDARSIEHGKDVAAAVLHSASGLRTHAGHFELLLEHHLGQLRPLGWFVKGLIPDSGIGCIYGPPGSGKSFLALDLLAHISNGWEWFGHRVKAAPAVYVPFEGQAGVPKRISAWRTVAQYSGGPTSSNLAFIFEGMDLRLAADRRKLVDTLVSRGWAGGILCLDTLAQSSPGVEENSSEGMGAMIAAFNELQRQLGGVVLVLHHTGKDKERGMRGWSGLPAALDFSIECSAGKSSLDRRFSITKQKDDASGKHFDFKLLKVHLGHDDDGDEVSSLAVAPPPVGGVKIAPIEMAGAVDLEDEEFVWEWARQEFEKGRYPSANSLQHQIGEMKATRTMTQVRVRAAVHRLKAKCRLKVEAKCPEHGNPWLRPVTVEEASGT